MNTYGNLALKESHEFEESLAFTQPKREVSGDCANAQDALRMARECLQVVSKKFLAGDIGVAHRTVQAWASGAEPIPSYRAIQIIVYTKGYFVDLSKLETEIDRMILRQFGKAGTSS